MYLDYKKHKSGVYVIDIETDGLNPKVIWVMCWQNVKTGEKGHCTSVQSIQDFFNDNSGSLFVGHNIIKFDGPVLRRIAGVDIGVHNVIDTLVLSTLYRPSLVGGHSLDAWGERLGQKKIEFNDWSKLTEEMITYCYKDVEITCTLFKRLISTLLSVDFSEQSIWIQHRITEVIENQHKNGFYFDGPKAVSLLSQLRQLENEAEAKVQEVFPPVRTLVATRPMYKKDGTFTQIYLKDRERYELEETENLGIYNAYEYVEFNLGSPVQRVTKLEELGWSTKPGDPLTKTGNPKPFEKGELAPSLEEFIKEKDVPEVKAIARWMVLNGRANMVNTWLESYNENDSKIHGKLFVADTLRFRHQAPNTANIPAVRVKESKDSSGNVVDKRILFGEEGQFTYEARNLWCAKPGRVLVGTDAAGLELRMLAHYLNRADFTEQVVEGDPHQYNADTVGISRPEAKTLIYAVLYGAGPPKIAATLGVSNREGARIRQMFLDKLGLTDLIEKVQDEQRRGRVTLCDGSKVVCPSPHSSLNYCLQGGGARVMALGSVLLEGSIQSQKLDSLKVGDIHDEWQYDVHPSDADAHAEASVQAIRKAGELLRLNVPLDGEAKVGKTWAETH